MKSKAAKFIHSETNRHGKKVFYFRRDRMRVRLPDDYGSDYFWECYQSALADEPMPHIRDLVPAKDDVRKAEIERIVRRAVAKAKSRAKAKLIDFNLTPEWAVEQVRKSGYRCPLTMIPFLHEQGPATFMRPFIPSMDKIDPKGGYTTDNVRIVVFAVNAMMMDWGDEVFSRVANGFRYVQNKKRTAYPLTEIQLTRTGV